MTIRLAGTWGWGLPPSPLNPPDVICVKLMQELVSSSNSLQKDISIHNETFQLPIQGTSVMQGRRVPSGAEPR